MTGRDSAAERPAVGLLHDLVTSRHSCRGFDGVPVGRELITEIIDLALHAPSWCNTQPWHLYVTSGEATERFRSAMSRVAATPDAYPDPDFPMPTAYTGVHLDRRRESGWQLYDAVGVQRGDRVASAAQASRNFDFFDAPHVAIVTAPYELGSYGLLDVGVFVAHFLLAAEERGVACIPQAALATYSGTVREFFGVPDDRGVALGISFGWRSDRDPARVYRTSRAPADEVVTYIEN